MSEAMLKKAIKNGIPNITPEEILAEAEEQMFGTANTGICIACGETRDGCEPDAREYECYSCGLMEVYGAEELMMMGFGE